MLKGKTQDECILESPFGDGEPFTESDPWRVFRIMGEFVEGFDTLAGWALRSRFSGRRAPSRTIPITRRLSRRRACWWNRVFRSLPAAGQELWRPAIAAQQENGTSVGLGIELPFEQGLNEYVDIGIEFRYFFVRKLNFFKYSQGFVIIPGGSVRWTSCLRH